MGLQKTPSERVAFTLTVAAGILLSVVVLFAALAPVFPCPHPPQDGTPGICGYCVGSRRISFIKQWQCRRDWAGWDEMVREMTIEQQKRSREAVTPPRLPP